MLNVREVYPLLFWLTWTLLLLLHFKLSHSAIIARGHPPLPPEDFTAMFIGPLFVGLPAAFGGRRIRWHGALISSIGFAAIYALAFINLNSARPHIGHLVGVYGIVQSSFIEYLAAVLILYLPVLIAIYFLERVTGDIVHGLTNRLVRLATKDGGTKR